MNWFSQYLDNLRNASLAEPIEFLAAIAPIIGFAGLIYLYLSGKLGKLIALFRPKPAEAKPNGFNEAQLPFDPDKPVLRISLDQYEARLKVREDELRDELSKAHADEKALLQAQIEELTRQQQNPEDAFQAFKTRIAELEALLGNAETEDEQAAKDALETGDLLKADEIFARISAAQALNIKKAADAEYARGEIAEQQIRWRDALIHFQRSAELYPSFKTLRQHWDLLWKMGLYNDAVPIGERLEKAAIEEFDKDSNENAIALSCRAEILRSLGRYDEAEPLYREALRIGEITIGKEHPDYATSLNNLAGLLKTTGRFEEAEPLYREAIEILTKSLGDDHPNTKTTRDNLEILLANTPQNPA